MAYEVESIATPNVPVQTTPQMREERVVDPYKGVSRMPKSGQTNTSETTSVASTAEPVKAPEESLSLSPAAAALARKERAFHQEKLALKAKEAALEKERLELSEFKTMKERLQAKDYSAIEGMVPYDEYTNYHVNKLNGSSPEAQALQEMKSEIETLKKSQSDDVSKRFEAAVKERRTAVTGLVESDPQFSRIKRAKQEETVVQHILDTWEHDGLELTPEQAAKEVEEIIAEHAKKWSALAEDLPATPVTETEKAAELPPLKKGVVNTLTNNMSVTGEIKRPNRSFNGMTDTERYAEARRRAEEKLKG